MSRLSTFRTCEELHCFLDMMLTHLHKLLHGLTQRIAGSELVTIIHIILNSNAHTQPDKYANKNWMDSLTLTPKHDTDVSVARGSSWILLISKVVNPTFHLGRKVCPPFNLHIF